MGCRGDRSSDLARGGDMKKKNRKSCDRPFFMGKTGGIAEPPFTRRDPIPPRRSITERAHPPLESTIAAQANPTARDQTKYEEKAPKSHTVRVAHSSKKKEEKKSQPEPNENPARIPGALSSSLATRKNTNNAGSDDTPCTSMKTRARAAETFTTGVHTLTIDTAGSFRGPALVPKKKTMKVSVGRCPNQFPQKITGMCAGEVRRTFRAGRAGSGGREQLAWTGEEDARPLSRLPSAFVLRSRCGVKVARQNPRTHQNRTTGVADWIFLASYKYSYLSHHLSSLPFGVRSFPTGFFLRRHHL